MLSTLSLSSLDPVPPGQRADGYQPLVTAVPPYLRIPILALATGLAYYLGTEFGYRFTPSDQPIGTLWPPNAILLAVFLLTPTRIWPFLLMGVLPAHLIAQLGKGVPLPAALGWFVGNAAEALAGAACIRHFTRQQRLFESLRSVVIFLCFGVLLAPFLTSFLDAAVVVVTRQANGYWMPWITRLSSNVLSQLIFVPIIVLVAGRGVRGIRSATPGRWLEAILLVSGTAIVSLLVFASNLTHAIPALICLPLAFLLWAALRFDFAMLSTSLLVIACISIWDAMKGHGPLPQASLTENVLFLHFFLLGLAVPLALLMGYSIENRRTSASLIASRKHLISWDEQERQRVGGVLHNQIVQQLTFLAAEVDRMRFVGPGGADLEALGREMTQVSDATLDLSHDVHPVVLEYAGLVPALRSLCRHAAKQSGIDIRFREHEVKGVDQPSSLALYRVAQAAVENIVNHSSARTATVDLAESHGNAVLRIEDDGIGIQNQKNLDLGIVIENMHERVTAINGVLDIQSFIGSKGTTITAKVPLSPESQPSPPEGAVRRSTVSNEDSAKGSER